MEETICELEHEVDCPIDKAWKILFSKDYDAFYLEKHNLGTCKEEDYEIIDDVIHRSVRITPNLAENILAKALVYTVKVTYGIDDISYLTIQKKNANKNKDCVYEMEFNNVQFKPDVDCLKSNGTIRLKESPENKNKCIMESTIYIRSDFPAAIKLIGGHDKFVSIVEQVTDESFTQMLSVINDYKISE